MSNEEPGPEVTPLPEGARAASGLPEVFGVITDLASWASATFPVTIVKNVSTAVSRLITTAADIPATWLEGRSREIKAVSDANVLLTQTAAEQLAKSMSVPEEFAVAAANKHAQQILRKQVNVQKVVGHAIEQLKVDAPQQAPEGGTDTPVPPVADISEDWLNAFEQEAANMSSETMQRHFGRILAGEIRKPASFSIKTVKLMAQLDNTAATLFTTLCSLAVSFRLPGEGFVFAQQVVSMGAAAGNSLQNYGLPFANLNVLNEYGLIISDFNAYNDYRLGIQQAGQPILPIFHQNRYWNLVPKSPRDVALPYNLNGVGFSASGKELMSIVDITPNDAYLNALKAYFEGQGFTMTEVIAPPFQGRS